MKHVKLVLALFLIGIVSEASSQFTNRFETLVTRNGKEYSNARPQRIEDGVLVVFHSSGIERIPISELSDDVLAALGLQTRAEAAQVKQRKREEAARRAEAKRRSEQERQAAAASDRQWREFRKNDPERKKRIEKGFSGWTGSHYELTDLVKKLMSDPKSYQHVKTVYSDTGDDSIIVTTTYRGKNAFGGVVVNWIKAECGLDGNVIRIISRGP